MIKVDLKCALSCVSLVVNLTFNNIQIYLDVQFFWLSTWRNHHWLIASHWHILSSTRHHWTMSDPFCTLFFEIYKGASNMHARRVALSTNDTPIITWQLYSPSRHLWTFCDRDEVSKFDHDSRNNDENVCKIPVFNNLRPIHKLWYKQHRKKYLSVRSKTFLLFVGQDTAQKSQHV